MYVIPQHKFAFLAAPRTGSKAVARALVERGAVLVGGHHTTPDEHPEVKLGSDWVVCSTVRNNWDAMISWWFKIERRAMCPLAVFLPRFCRNNPNFIKDGQLWWKTLPHTNTILRYDLLASDLDQALVGAGMAPIDLPTVIDSKREGKPYQVFYRTPTREWVGNHFAYEIKKFGYKF